MIKMCICYSSFKIHLLKTTCCTGFAGIKMEDVRGIRAPFLAIGELYFQSTELGIRDNARDNATILEG